MPQPNVHSSKCLTIFHAPEYKLFFYFDSKDQPLVELRRQQHYIDIPSTVLGMGGTINPGYQYSQTDGDRNNIYFLIKTIIGWSSLNSQLIINVELYIIVMSLY